MLRPAQINNRSQWIVKQLYGLDPDDIKAVLKQAYGILLPKTQEAKSDEPVEPVDPEAARVKAFWEGIDKNLKLGDSPTLKLYNEIMERNEAREITKDVHIYIEHDDIPDMVLNTALKSTGIEFASTCKGIEEAATVPYSPPG